MNAAIGPNTPLRLKDALEVAFPAGGMTLSGLRREIKKGRLNCEMIAGKAFVTLQDIEEMREKCRVHAKELASGSGRSGSSGTEQSLNPSGSSETDNMRSPQDALRTKLEKLSGNSRSTSTRNTPRLVKSAT